MHVSDRNRGYFQALYGMLLTMKSSDRYSFLASIDFTNKKQLNNYRKEFLGHVESRLHDEYDRGYFEAWFDYMKILPPAPLNNKNAAKQAEETAMQEVPTEVNAPADATATSKEAPTEDAPEEKSIKSSQSLIVDYAE
jgi:hypothetical protein